MQIEPQKKETDANLLHADNSKILRRLICLCLIAAVFSVYWQTLGNDFTNFDDNVYVTQNDHVKSGLSIKGLAWAFSTNYASNWHPLTWLSHMFDYQLFDSNPAGHHLTNLFLHMVNTLMLFMVLTRMTGAFWQSAFVVALFAIHPLNVESVAWVAERKNILSTFFWLLTMWTYVRYTEKRNVSRYLLALMFFVMGLMSKPMLVTLPFVLLMLDYWPLKRLSLSRQKNGDDQGEKISRLIWEKIPFLTLAIVSCVVTYMAQNRGGSVQSIQLYSVQSRIINALVSYIEYLEKMIWPSNLAVLYPHPGETLPLWQGSVCAIALICISIAVIKMIRKAPYLAVGWFWYLGTLVPVIGIVQVGAQAMADRYAYIPLIGIFIAVAWGMPALLQNRSWRNTTLSLSAGIIIGALMIVSWAQAKHWKNSVTLFQNAIDKVPTDQPNFALVHLNLGYSLADNDLVDEAIIHYKEAIRLKPDYIKAHNNLGIAYSLKFKFKEAMASYERVIAMAPNHAPAYNNIGIIFDKQKIPDMAVTSFKEAIRLLPSYSKAHNNLGNTLRRMGKYEEAILHFKDAIKHYQNFPEAYNNIGRSLTYLMKFDEAEQYFKRAIELRPRYADAYFNFGVALRRQNRFEEAINNFQTAIKIFPDFAHAHNGLGEALINIKKSDEAIIHYGKAIAIKPDFADAYNNLGAALLIAGKTRAAVPLFKLAIKFKPDNSIAHNSLGISLSILENLKEAIPHYRESIKLNPDGAEAHNNLGKALIMQKQAKEAITHFREAIRINPNYAHAINNLKAALQADKGN